jgi:hypothetical protein
MNMDYKQLILQMCSSPSSDYKGESLEKLVQYFLNLDQFNYLTLWKDIWIAMQGARHPVNCGGNAEHGLYIGMLQVRNAIEAKKPERTPLSPRALLALEKGRAKLRERAKTTQEKITEEAKAILAREDHARNVAEEARRLREEAKLYILNEEEMLFLQVKPVCNVCNK